MAVDVKICGLTRVEDVELACARGAWRLGVIFAGGPRLQTSAQAAELVRAAGGVPMIGVFGHQPAEEILRIAAEVGLAGAQLHGPSTPEMVQRLTDAGLEVWRVLRVPGPDGALPATRPGGEAVVLLEPPAQANDPTAGGRGLPVDLSAARAARMAIGKMTRVGLAGGLTPERLEEAIRVVNPDIVDVSSGVETSPGIKDPTRLIRFLEIARDAHPAA